MRIFRFEHVATAMDGAKRYAAARDLLAQSMDVNLDRVEADVALATVDLLEQPLLADDLPEMHEQRFEKTDLARGKIDRHVIDRDGMRHGVERQPCAPEPRRIGVAASPQERADARLQLVQGKRLHQIVIGAAVESLHALVTGIAPGEDQHRRGRTSRPKTAEHVKAIETRKT